MAKYHLGDIQAALIDFRADSLATKIRKPINYLHSIFERYPRDIGGEPPYHDPRPKMPYFPNDDDQDQPPRQPKRSSGYDDIHEI